MVVHPDANDVARPQRDPPGSPARRSNEFNRNCQLAAQTGAFVLVVQLPEVTVLHDVFQALDHLPDSRTLSHDQGRSDAREGLIALIQDAIEAPIYHDRELLPVARGHHLDVRGACAVAPALSNRLLEFVQPRAVSDGDTPPDLGHTGADDHGLHARDQSVYWYSVGYPGNGGVGLYPGHRRQGKLAVGVVQVNGTGWVQ